MLSRKKFEKVYYYDFPIVKQYFWYINCVRLRLTGHLVSGNRYCVDSGTGSTYVDSYRISVLDTGSNSVTVFCDRFWEGLTILI